MDELLAEFLTETAEGIAELDTALLQLESTPDHAPTLALVFRLMHTIKGTCGFLGLPRLERVAHAAEEVLGRVRDGALAADRDLVSVVLAALDRISTILAGLAAHGTEPAGDDRALIAALLGGDGGSAAAVAQDLVLSGQMEPAGADPVVAIQGAAEPMNAAGKRAPDAPAEPAATAQTVRVAVEVLENLLALVSELVLTRNQLVQLARSQESHRPGRGGAGSAMDPSGASVFSIPLQRLSQLTSDLQEGVMKTRMQPVGAAWNKLPRLVRDLSHELAKPIELIMTGAETELDRQVLELIRDPLTHMVRNSADHGLEDAATRRAADKPETGRISLSALHEGGHITIEIADDGRGLDLARLRAKAVALGLATASELETMPEAQVQRFILHPGFSTASAVTAVSGRGVGMDVVKTNVEKIGGTVDLKSSTGKGTTVTLQIPLTLAIISALVVEAAGQRFAIPQASIGELLHAGTHLTANAAAERSSIEDLGGASVLRLRERLLPLVSLQALLRLQPDLQPEAARPADRSILVARVGASDLGIVVDRVLGTEEIVVKPVAPILRHIALYSGNTILGDGSAIMILDPAGIARAIGVVAAPHAGSRLHGKPGKHKADAADARPERSEDRTAMLLFRIGEAMMAVPLGLVARVEQIPRERLERLAGHEQGASVQAVTQYRGVLMPLIPLAGSLDWERAHQSVLVFSDGVASSPADAVRERCVGLVVDQIVDVIEERLRIELGHQSGDAGTRGVLGTAIVAGRAVGVLDTRHWLTAAYPDWFVQRGRDHPRAPRLLVVEDSSFFRQLLVPVLAAAGYTVTAASGASQALRLRDSGAMFEAIVSDVEMPDIDGLEFVRALRSSGAWTHLPVIALSGRMSAGDISIGRDAGFTDYVGKFEQERLLASLRSRLDHAALVPGRHGSIAA